MEKEILDSLEAAERVLNQHVDRRLFVKKLAVWSGGIILGGYLTGIVSCGKKEETEAVPKSKSAVSQKKAVPEGPADMVIAHGQDIQAMVRQGLDKLGGMSRFVQAGDMVVVKPNASFPCEPQKATTTDPGIVATVVKMCKECGASRVVVMDHTLADVPEICFSRSGIRNAAEANGAEIVAYPSGDHGHGTEVEIEGGEVLKRIGIYPQVLAADVIINLPKAKHHSSATLTLSMKNLMGLTTTMGKFHEIDLLQAIADINTAIKPQLHVMDATRILLTGGPGGPGKTADTQRVIAGTDPVAVDSYTATLFGLTGGDIGYIVNGARMGLGTADYSSLKVEEVTVGK